MLIIMVILLTTSPPSSPDLTKLNYKINAWNGLNILDKTGELRLLAVNNNAQKIKEDLKPYIDVNYDVVILNKTSNTTSIPSINSENVAVVSYFIAGMPGKYKPIEIRVYMWGFR